MACGTGNFTNALKKLNFSIEGSDLSSKMISIAKTKFPDILFYKKDMTLPLNKKYDVVFCMFNSIAHLDKSNFSLMLKNISHFTKVFVFDIFNLDFMKKNFIRNEFLDLAKTKGDLKIVRFNNNTLDVKKGIMNITQKTIIQKGFSLKRYFPEWQMQIYTAEELRKLLSEAGFNKITILGSFTNGCFEEFKKEKSISMHVVAEHI